MRTTQVVLSFAIAAATIAQAATYTWDGGSSGQWADGGTGWQPGSYPSGSGVTETEALFGGTLPASVALSGTVYANKISFTAASYAISGGTQITMNGTAPTITVGSGISDSITSVLAGTDGLTKAGDGTLTLGGANNYSGGTTVDGGTLVLASAGFASTILHGVATVNNGATLKLTGNGNTAVTDIINVNGGRLVLANAVDKDASPLVGTVNLDSAGGSSATVDTSDGSSIRFAQGGLGALTSTGATANAVSANVELVNLVTTYPLAVTAAPGNTLNIAGRIFDYPGLTGAPVVFDGAGTVVLSGNNAYYGTTTVSGGTLVGLLPSTGWTQTSSGVTVSNGATYKLDFSNQPDLGLPPLVRQIYGSSPFAAPGGRWAVLLTTGQSLTAGQSAGLAGTTYHLEMQTDGNLVLYDSGTARWASGTSGSGNYAIMQYDGNFVVYHSDNSFAGWASYGSGGSGCVVVLGANGGLAVAAHPSCDNIGSNVVAGSMELYSMNGLAPFVGGVVITSGGITGSGILNKTGAGSVDFAPFDSVGNRVSATGSNGLNNFNGTLNIQAGTLASDSQTNSTPVGSGQMQVNVSGGAVLDIAAGGFRVDTLSGSGTVASSAGLNSPTLVVGSNNGTATFAGAIGDSLALTKAGAGTQTLSGTNTYAGATTVNGGTLTIGGAGQLGSGAYAGAISLGLSASNSLEYGSSANQILRGAITGSGSLVQSGSGTLTLAGTNTYTGTTTITGGALELAAAGRLSGSDVTVSSAALRIDSTGKTLQSLTVADGSTLVLPSTGVTGTALATALTLASTPSFTVKPMIFGGMPIAGSTYKLLSGATAVVGTPGTITVDLSAYNPTRIAGTVAPLGNDLVLTITNGVASLVWNCPVSGTWDLATTPNFLDGATSDTFQRFDAVTFDDSVTPGTVTLSGNLEPSVVTVTNSTGDYTFSGGAIVGFATLVKAGTNTLTMTAVNTYSGGTTINGGTLTIDGSGQLGGGSYAGGISIASGARLRFNTEATQILGGNLVGAGSLFQSGAGTLILTGANTYSGGTTIDAGTLQISDGTANGSIGSGSYTLASGAKLYLDYATVSAADWVNIAGPGTLEVNATTSGDWNGTLAAGFTGTLQIDKGRQWVSLGGATHVIVKDGGQFAPWTGAYTQSFTLAGTGWGEGGYETSIRSLNGTISGNVTLAAATAIGADGTLQLDGTLDGGGYVLSVGAGNERGTVTLNNAAGSLAGLVINNGALAVGTNGNVSADGAWLNGKTLGVYGALAVTGGIDGGGRGARLYVADTGSLTASSCGFAWNPNQFQIDGTASLGGVTFSVAANPSMTGTGTLTVSSLTIRNWTDLTDNMTGGTLKVGSGGIVNGGNGNNYFRAGATTIGATASWSSTMEITLNDATVGTTFDTTGGSIALAGALIGSGALKKTGSNALTLFGNNTYAGDTTVSDGLFLILATNSGTGAVSVNAGTLSGTGQIAGPVRVNSAGHLSSGSGLGTLTLAGGLFLNDGAILDFGVGSAAGTLRVTGGTFTGSGTAGTTLQISLDDAARQTPYATFVLIDWSGAAASGVDVGDFQLALPPDYSGQAKLSIQGNSLVLGLYHGTFLIVR